MPQVPVKANATRKIWKKFFVVVALSSQKFQSILYTLELIFQVSSSSLCNQLCHIHVYRVEVWSNHLLTDSPLPRLSEAVSVRATLSPVTRQGAALVFTYHYHPTWLSLLSAN